MNLSKIWNDLNDENKGGHPVAGCLTVGVALAIPVVFYIYGIFASMNLEGHKIIRKEWENADNRVNYLENKLQRTYIPNILVLDNRGKSYQDSLTFTLREIDSLNKIKNLDEIKVKEIESNKKNFLSWGYFVYKKARGK